jgi:uncharacterized protein (TIGR00661 family)
MARIIYGVAGEGSGHSSRSREIIAYLQSRGHTVKVVSYDRGYRNLCDKFDVFETEGLSISSTDNRVSKIKTFTDNLQKLPRGHKKLQELRKEIFKKFEPDCVFTDFEPMTAYLAIHYDLPLISVDNQHRLRYMIYTCPHHLKQDELLTRNIIRAIVPKPDVALVTTFYFGQPKNERTYFFPPILREAVRNLQSCTEDHILVYLTGGFETFLAKLTQFQREKFRVYGYSRDDAEGNLQYRPFSKNGFLHDLASCKAVMATAGFTLMTEALYLRKPYLALPMRGQFEQEINAYFLARLQYGKCMRRVNGQAIGDFLYRLPDYRENLNKYSAADNSAIQSKIDELLADDCALARQYHRQRQAGFAETWVSTM